MREFPLSTKQGDWYYAETVQNRSFLTPRISTPPRQGEVPMHAARAEAGVLIGFLVLALCLVHVQAFLVSPLSGFVPKIQSSNTRARDAVLSLRSPVLRGRDLRLAPKVERRRSEAHALKLQMVNQNVLNLMIGAIAGCVANAATFPIDAAKTRVQALNASDPGAQVGIIGTMAKIVREEGVGGLYKGSLPVVLGAAPETAIQLSIYDLVLGTLRNFENLQQSLATVPVHLQALAGGVAGLSTVIATNPLEVLKIRAQTNNESLSLTEQIRELGFAGLFNGYEATWFRDVPFAAIYFPVYTNMKVCAAPFCSGSLGSALVAGMVSGLMAGLVTTPADVIMTTFHTGSRQSDPSGMPRTTTHIGGRATDVSDLPRATEPAAIGEFVSAEELAAERRLVAEQLAATEAVAGKKSPIRIGSDLLAEQGWPGLFRGVQGRLGKMAPAMAISLCVYETLQGWLSVPVPLQTGPVVLAQADQISSPLLEKATPQVMAMVEAVGGEAAGTVVEAASKVSQVDMQVVQDAAQTCGPGWAEAIDVVTTAAMTAACNL